MSDSVPFEIILRSPWGGPWRRFSRPFQVIAAHDRLDVRDALAQIDQAVRGGAYAAGFVTYEAAGAFGLPVQQPTAGLPLLCFGLFSPEQVEPLNRFPAVGGASLGEWQPSIDHSAYLRAIERIKSSIEAGDTYQINFTFRLTAPFEGEPAALMRDLYAGQAGPWSAYVEAGDHVICSASPELFFSLEGDRLICRPMKGTAPRGYWTAQDDALGKALHDSEKNRAENVMIVDMVRNDIGRIARTGSVKATSLFDVERYPLQWQMTSTVEGSVETRSLLRLFEAMFPSGSITGAPKHSSMNIIRELETTPRGIYTGAIGYASPRGGAHFNVAIRSVLINRRHGTAEFGVGSGIVWDSVDRDEYEECLLKARVIGSVATQPQRSPSYAVPDPPGFRLLETINWTPGAGFGLLDRHIDRICASAACFGIPCDAAEMRTMLANAVGDLRGPSKVRLLLEADGGLLCEAVDLVRLNDPVRVAFAVAPVDKEDVFLYHKTTRRDVYERAKAGRPEADTVILWNSDGEVTEAAESNIVLGLRGVKVTPPVSSGLLPGTMRAELLERGEIAERIVTVDEVRAAEEIWLINSVRGWMRAVLVQ
ncbi:MAG TPA: aminodeoxychorismate synthase component I [Vicinamibacterales bacterium]|nr:aminodeoxychorismate synthase component I [Vicinamibacterales bacterium]